MNWDDIRIFLAIYRAGSLRGAGLELHIDPTTVGRRLSAMERNLSSTLFLRSSAGYVPTESGWSALAVGEAMERCAISFEHLSAGADKRVSGDVRVTTTDTLAADFIVPAIGQVHARFPDVRVALTTTTDVLDLTRREADIAVRTLRPSHSELIVRKLAQWEVGLFASRRYIEKRGIPRRGEAFARHDVAMYQPGITVRQTGTLAGEPITQGKVVAELNSSLMLATIVRAGLALAELPVYLAKGDPDLVRIWPQCKRKMDYEVWLALHKDFAHVARVRVVVDAIVDEFEQVKKDINRSANRMVN